MIALTIALAVLVGVTLGLLGGGGAILTVPLLVYVAGMETKQAIATSLLVVGVTSAVAATSHARAGMVQWRTGLVIGAASMAGALAGGLLAQFISGTALLIGFAVIMIATAATMLRGRREAGPADAAGSMPVVTIMWVGLAVGLVTGLVGAGGGFLMVPALALLGGLPMPVAVGTSLAVIAMNSFAGLAGQLARVPVDWALAGAVTAAALAGGVIGARVSARVNPDALHKTFGWFLLAMSSVILGQEIHPAAGTAAAVLTALAAAITFACTRYALPVAAIRQPAARRRRG
ncbi:sulfite exporter TauE/SafE family protein [Mycolicibacterium novocastrense]|uniref:Probable membrane transporter protein n=1 Tax=Mycolicibacterium novocastrense TaxID=59813 RepID=A0AAW5SKK0_MYCNV|nr:sulfite exporter TauE/SafE family protein [Mycolicibacterium novocastrense]GAT06890.1 permease [Mycolicibacterium novocastrense]